MGAADIDLTDDAAARVVAVSGATKAVGAGDASRAWR